MKNVVIFFTAHSDENSGDLQINSKGDYQNLDYVFGHILKPLLERVKNENCDVSFFLQACGGMMNNRNSLFRLTQIVKK